MDQLIYASLSHTHYWHEVGMLKVPVLLHDVGVRSIPQGSIVVDPSLETTRVNPERFFFYHHGTKILYGVQRYY